MGVDVDLHVVAVYTVQGLAGLQHFNYLVLYSTKSQFPIKRNISDF